MQTFLLDAENSDSFYIGLQTDVEEFRSLKLYLAVIYDAEYEYQLIQLSGPERKKDQQERVQGKLKSKGKEEGKKRLRVLVSACVWFFGFLSTLFSSNG